MKKSTLIFGTILFLYLGIAFFGNPDRTRNYFIPDRANIHLTDMGTSPQHKLFQQSNDIVQFDHYTLANIRATHEGAHSHLEWSPKSLADVTPADELHSVFQAIPLLATVDRRPLIVRKQLWDDNAGPGNGLADGGNLLGCAISSTTFVSDLESQYLKHYKEYTHTCDVCFQFSNREDMKNFIPGAGYEPVLPQHSSIATKCFGGKATLTARFADWQQKDAR